MVKFASEAYELLYKNISNVNVVTFARALKEM